MKEILFNLNRISYRKIIWIIAVTETIHNLEEALWLPDWSKTAGAWHSPVGEFEFRFAVALVTLIFYLAIYYFTKNDNKFSKYLISGVLIVILLNVFVPHLAATFILGKYAPGVAAGVILNIPAASYLLRRGLKEGFFEYKNLIPGGAGFAAVMLLLLPVFFVMGRFIRSVI